MALLEARSYQSQAVAEYCQIHEVECQRRPRGNGVQVGVPDQTTVFDWQSTHHLRVMESMQVEHGLESRRKPTSSTLVSRSS